MTPALRKNLRVYPLLLRRLSHLLFSPIGIAGGSLKLFSLLSCAIVLVNIGAWYRAQTAKIGSPLLVESSNLSRPHGEKYRYDRYDSTKHDE